MAGKQKRGFAVMSKAQRSAIAAKGGAAVPADQRPFSRDRELASRAGKAGAAKKAHLPPSE